MAQSRTYPGRQLSHAERFADIVVRPEVERLDFGAFVVSGRQNNDRDSRLLTEFGDNLEPAAVRQAEIEDHDVGLFDHKRSERGGSILGDDNSITYSAKAGAQK